MLHRSLTYRNLYLLGGPSTEAHEVTEALKLTWESALKELVWAKINTLAIDNLLKALTGQATDTVGPLRTTISLVDAATGAAVSPFQRILCDVGPTASGIVRFVVLASDELLLAMEEGRCWPALIESVAKRLSDWIDWNRKVSPTFSRYNLVVQPRRPRFVGVVMHLRGDSGYHSNGNTSALALLVDHFALASPKPHIDWCQKAIDRANQSAPRYNVWIANIPDVGNLASEAQRLGQAIWDREKAPSSHPNSHVPTGVRNQYVQSITTIRDRLLRSSGTDSPCTKCLASVSTLPPEETDYVYVAFLDILGYRSLIDRDTNDPKHELLNDLMKAFDSVEHIDEVLFNVQCLADSIILTCQRHERFPAFLDVLRNVFLRFLENHLLIRGGLAYCGHVRYSRLTYSPALKRAVELEESTLYPRILIDDNIIDMYKWGVRLLSKEVGKRVDVEHGKYFLKPLFNEAEDERQKAKEAIDKIMTINATLMLTDERVWIKCDWLRRYLYGYDHFRVPA